MGGIVRGGVSFALILTIEGENAEILQITVLALVIVGTLIFGTALPLWVMLRDVKEVSTSFVAPEDHGHAAVPVENEEKKGKLHRWWRNFDDNYIKKFLIHEEELNEQRKVRESVAQKKNEEDATEERKIE